MAAVKPAFSDAGHGGVSTASIFAAFDSALGVPPAAEGRRHDCHGGLSRAVSRPRDDGADGLHGEGGERPGRGVDRRAGSAERTLHRGQGARRRGGERPPDELHAGWRLRPASAVHVRLRGPRRAGGAGDVADAGQDDLDARERHPDRLLPGRGDVPPCRRAGRERGAAGRAFELHRRRQQRGGVHAVRDCGAERRGEGGRPPHQAGAVAVGAELTARLLQGVVHRRDGARRRQGSRSSSAAGCSASSRASRPRSRRRRSSPAGACRCLAAKAAASRSAKASAPSWPRWSTSPCPRMGS